MTEGIYTDYVEQRKLDDFFFALVYQATLLAEFVWWADLRKWQG